MEAACREGLSGEQTRWGDGVFCSSFCNTLKMFKFKAVLYIFRNFIQGGERGARLRFQQIRRDKPGYKIFSMIQTGLSKGLGGMPLPKCTPAKAFVISKSVAALSMWGWHWSFRSAYTYIGIGMKF